ncbi:MAG: 16S rRNA (cytosine(1402)-N(4))-methyltransferase RsmH [Clostridia bacterium]|nr:16S rRNA (cytosine(1402)-N(4))-methyltransferase RsmH [Clostridia bacterium]
MDGGFHHVSVLLHEATDALNIRDGYTYADLTTGGAGHSYEIARRLGKGGRLICFDRDSEALAAAKKRLAEFGDRVIFVHDNFESIGHVLADLKVENFGGAIADLGCSSHQFDTPERGFAYQHDAPLDMRMDTEATLTAREIVNTYSEAELCRIIRDYGEERFAAKIAARIVTARAAAPIETTVELSEIIKSAIPAAARADGPHPAKRTFQAIRIETNRELDAISPAISSVIEALVPGGRLSIISFHSLEDRAVKTAFAAAATGCTCPRDFPVCVCGKKPKIEILTKKPILPSEEELADNPRSRSAKLRVAEKL